jgi:hypothetical protein
MRALPSAELQQRLAAVRYTVPAAATDDGSEQH